MGGAERDWDAIVLLQSLSLNDPLRDRVETLVELERKISVERQTIDRLLRGREDSMQLGEPAVTIADGDSSKSVPPVVDALSKRKPTNIPVAQHIDTTAACLPPQSNVLGFPAVAEICATVRTCESTKALDAEPQVALVGAGLGDIGLLTVAAVQAITKADVVLADRLVSREILDLATGRVVTAKKVPGRAHEAQRELDREGLAALEAGQTVVRLKGGDPFVFGRGGEEALWYSSHGYTIRVIPGISSSIAAAACAGIPMTTRGVADRFVVTTGHGRDGSKPVLPDYSSTCTFVFLMSIGRLGQLTAELLARGFPGDTPAAIVQSASTARQRTVRSSVTAVAEDAETAGIVAPAVVVVGNVVECLESASLVQIYGKGEGLVQ